MVTAGTFHSVAVELVMGALALATFAAILCCIPRLANLRSSLDAAALWGAAFGLSVMPVVIITGNLAAGGEAGSPLIANKMLLSAFGLALWIGFLHGRISLGPLVWERRSTAVIQVGVALLGFEVMTWLGSTGGVLSRGETIYDLLGLPHLSSAPDMGIGLSAAILVLGLAAFIVVLFVQPKANQA